MSCITEILKLKGDKDVLVPEGKEIAVEGGGTYKNYEYLIVLNTNGYRCGYVGIPPEHKYSQTPEESRTLFGSQPFSHWEYNALNIECHGHLTFMSPNHGLKDLLTTICNDMWIGFDCGHYDDSCDVPAMRKYFGDEMTDQKKSFISEMNSHLGQTVKDFNYVKIECQSIIDQLIQAV